MTTNTPIKLTEAVAAVMREVHRLRKDETNKHGGYKYVSVDDVKDHVRPLLGKHGLEVAISEVEFGVDSLQTKNGTTVSAKISYEVSLRHVSGEECKPERITVMLPYTGAQTTGAARSYAIKEWLKGRFLVSTGEKDIIEGGADADAYGQTEYIKPAPAPHAKPEAMPSVNGTPGASKAGSRAAYEKMIASIRSTATLRALDEWYKANVAEIDKLPPEWLDELRMEYVDRQSDLKKTLAA